MAILLTGWGAAAVAGPAGLIDDFEDTDLSEYTFTKVLDQGAATNISFSSPSGILQSTSSGADGAEQVLFFRNDGFSLATGEELRVDSAMTTANNGGQLADLGIAIGATPTPGVRENFLFVSFRGLTQLNSRGFIGTAEQAQVQAFGVTADVLFIARPTETSIELGYYTGSVRTVMTTRDITGNLSITNNVGFYTDLRADAALYSGLDNLRIQGPLVPGDVTGDGDVDGEDFEVIRMNLFRAVLTREEGDLNGDGVVNFADFREWKSNKTSGGGNLSLFGKVPEPSSFVLSLLAGATVSLVRLRRRSKVG